MFVPSVIDKIVPLAENVKPPKSFFISAISDASVSPSLRLITLFIKLFEHGCQVKEDGFLPSTINTCCNHNTMSAYGYIWKFKDDSTRIINNCKGRTKSSHGCIWKYYEEECVA